MVKIRKAVKGDLEALARLKYEGDLFHSRLPIWPPECDMGEARKGAKKHLESKGCIIFLATTSQGEPIGFISGETTTRNTVHRDYRKIGVIDLLFVAEKYRGKGVGRKLVAACMDIFEKKRIKHLTLRSVVGNDLSERFWGSLGFEPKVYMRSGTIDNVRERLRRR